MTNSSSGGQYFSIIPHWVIFSGLSSGAIHLYAVIAKYADYDTHEAFPSRSTLAKGVGKSVDTVDRLIRELQKAGAIEVEKRKRPGSHENQTNIYRLIYEQPGVAAPIRPPHEENHEVAAPVRPGVGAPVRPGSRMDAVENEIYLTKSILNQNPRLSDVSLSSAENDFSGEEEDEKNVEEIKNQIFKSLGMKRRKAS